MNLNRSAVLVRPRAPFLHWAKTHGDGVEYSASDEHTVYLLPSFAMLDEIDEILQHYYDIIFESELADWVQDEETWPQGRSYAMFRSWFHVEVNSMVLDLVAGEPLVEKQPFGDRDDEEP
jgi:hypothetical protein